MVAFVLKNERDHFIFFCPLQSDKATAILTNAGLKTIDPETMYFLGNGNVLERSDAALQVALHLRWNYRWLRIFRVIPKSWRNSMYDFIAKRRKKLRKGFCVLPEESHRSRFL
jgi:predicted DCC family thiol-disulfide oxidoreductase YuxK